MSLAAAPGMTNQPPASRDDLRDFIWPYPPPLAASSFAEVMAAIRPYISKNLHDGWGWERMLACTRDLPAEAANYWFGFEYKLQDPLPSADLCIGVGLHSSVSRHYANRGKATGADAASAAFAQTLLESERDGSFLSQIIGGAIVEYDISTELGSRSPGIFLACPEFWDHKKRGYTNPGALTAALAAATAQPECDKQRRAVEMLFDALPSGARIAYAGAFPGRGSPAIRLLIAGIEADEAPGTLQRVNWPGSVSAAAAAVSGFRDLTPYITVAIDAGPDGISPRLGLEMFQSPSLLDRFESSPEVWHRFIDRLVEHDLCLPAKAVGLRDTVRVQFVADPTSGFRARRVINHFKIGLHDDSVEAKAYVSFSPMPPPLTPLILRLFR